MFSSDGYRAIRRASALVRRHDRGVLAASGADRRVWLQGLLTNDVEALGAGQSCYAAYLTPQGRMITDMRVVNLSDRTLLEVPAALAASLRARLDSLLFAEDASIADISAAVAVLDILGPSAPVVVDRAHRTSPWPAVDAMRDDVYGVPGVTLIAPRDREEAVAAALAGAGAVETTLETLDVVRIEAGRPLFLVDMDDHTIPLEAGIEDRAISFTKGCYVGQEVIVRVTQRGHGRVAKQLVGLLFDQGAAPHREDVIRADGRDIGRVTSAAWSPALERPIALGYVHRDFTKPGTAVQVVTTTGDTSASVHELPFVTA